MPDPTAATTLSSIIHRHSGQRREGIGLALSGGGYRAMLFHTGALIRLNELGLLSKVRRISSVSGGSIAAGLLAFRWRDLAWKQNDNGRQIATNLDDVFVARAIAASKISFDRRAGIFGFLTQGRVAAHCAQRVYDKLLEHKTLQELPDDGTCGGEREGPRFIFCATNLSTGSLFRFSRAYMADYRIGLADFPNLPLATAVAASAAFPPVLSPLRLKLSSYEFKAEPEPDPDNEELPPDPLPAKLRKRALLTDGGVYDNHALETLKGWPLVFVSDGGMPHSLHTRGFCTWYGQMRRVIDVTDNQVRSLRRRGLIERFTNIADLHRLQIPETDRLYHRTGLKGVYWGIGTNPDKYTHVDGLLCPRDRVQALARVATRLTDIGDRVRDALINWGYAICDKSVRAWHLPGATPPTDWPRTGGLSSW
jgi:NTE family protein